jgi:hypothetical protein
VTCPSWPEVREIVESSAQEVIECFRHRARHYLIRPDRFTQGNLANITQVTKAYINPIERYQIRVTILSG